MNEIRFRYIAPGFNFRPFEAFLIDHDRPFLQFCPRQIATFPALHVYNTSSVLRRAHLNLAQGTCFTFESGEDSERSSLRTDVLGVLPGEGRVVSFILLAHQHGGFVSALGLGSQFAGELTLSTR